MKNRELIALRAEVAHLRSMVGVGRRGSAIVRRAHADALTIVQAHYLGHNTGRVEMRRQGMGKRRWAWAVAYLRFAQVIAYRTRDWRLGLQWIEPEARALSLLSQARPTLAQLRLCRRQT